MRVVLAALVLSVAFAASARAEREALPEPHTDAQLKEHEVFDKFESKYASDDMDARISVLRWFGQWRHKKVLKQLKKIWLKEKDFELKAAAAEGLGRQTSFPKDAGKVLIQGLEKMEKVAGREDPEDEEALAQALEARALVAGIKALADLGPTNTWKRDGWKKTKGFIEHNHDDVAGEMMITCGRLKEYRALPILLEWFNFYPDGMTWSGGSVKVDTGAGGNKDANAAKAKWKAKFGGRKKKARPAAWEKLIQSLEMITGVKFEKAKELKQWMDDNKVLLRKHGA